MKMPDMAWRSEKGERAGIRRPTEEDFLFFCPPAKLNFLSAILEEKR
jgi:hypothetical protein